MQIRKPRIYVDFNEMIAEGVVEANKIKSGWGSIAKWCCRIDKNGIRYEADEE